MNRLLWIILCLVGLSAGLFADGIEQIYGKLTGKTHACSGGWHFEPDESDSLERIFFVVQGPQDMYDYAQMVQDSLPLLVIGRTEFFRIPNCYWIFPDTIIVLNSTGVESGQTVSQPAMFTLRQNYPNPFNQGTIIEFTLHQRGYVCLLIYNLQGQKVADLRKPQYLLFPGVHSCEWHPAGLSSGVYLLHLKYWWGEFCQEDTRRVVFMK